MIMFVSGGGGRWGGWGCVQQEGIVCMSVAHRPICSTPLAAREGLQHSSQPALIHLPAVSLVVAV